MKRLLYTPRAQSDIFDIIDYTAETIGDGDLAFDVGERIYDQCEKLAGLPGRLGRSREGLGQGLRSFPFGSYVIIFKYIGDDTFEVARVLHAKRDIDALFGNTDPES